MELSTGLTEDLYMNLPTYQVAKPSVDTYVKTRSAFPKEIGQKLPGAPKLPVWVLLS